MIGTITVGNIPYHSEEDYDEEGNVIGEHLILDEKGKPVKKWECLCCAYGPSECICGAWDEPIGEI